VFSSGFDLNARGTCAMAPGKFACGYVQCNLDSQDCLHEVHPSEADTYSCVGQPACGSQSGCACLANERCGRACTGDATAGLTVTCS